jgi:hypothetical protein
VWYEQVVIEYVVAIMMIFYLVLMNNQGKYKMMKVGGGLVIKRDQTWIEMDDDMLACLLNLGYDCHEVVLVIK